MTELRPPHEKLQGMMEKDSVLAWHSHAPRCRAAPGGRASTHVGRQGRTLTWRRRQGIISERIVVRKLLPAQSHPPLANKNKRSRRPARGQRKRQTRGTTGDRARSPVPWPAGQRSPAIASCGQRLLSLLAFVYFEKTRVPWPDVVRRVHTLQGSARRCRVERAGPRGENCRACSCGRRHLAPQGWATGSRRGASAGGGTSLDRPPEATACTRCDLSSHRRGQGCLPSRLRSVYVRFAYACA